MEPTNKNGFFRVFAVLSKKISIIFLVILAIISIIFLEAGISLKSDLELMKDDRTLVLIIDPLESNSVQAAIGMAGKNESETIYMDSYQILGDGSHLNTVLSPSVHNGSQKLIGENLRGIDSNGNQINFQVERVLVVNDSLIQDIFNLTGPLTVEFGLGKSIQIKKTVTKDDIFAIFNNEKLDGWHVSISEPITGKTRNSTLSQDGIEMMLELGDFNSVDLDKIIKLAIFKQLIKEINSKDLYDDILKLMLDAYKRGDVITYPETTYAKFLKHSSPFWFN